MGNAVVRDVKRAETEVIFETLDHGEVVIGKVEFLQGTQGGQRCR